ncbi:MAG: hypothetical protein F7C07_02865 [Desulfurococcales archaeon]|nr:hypothetical protein [Desulfurococcales archaeon]
MSLVLEVRLRETLNDIVRAAREVELINGSEEDLKIRIENILRESIWSRLGVPNPRYEYRVDAGTYARSFGRVDALYGLTIFEYKRPRSLRTRERDEALRKLKEEYIPGLLKEDWAKALISKAREKGLSPRIIGIVLDGYGVIFAEYHVETGQFLVDPEVGFYHLDSENGVYYLRRIVRSVIATFKKKIDARVLASDFGYTSSIARNAVKTLYYKLAKPKSRKTRTLFNEWFKTISQAYPVSGEELKRIAELYGFKDRELGEIDGLKLFYAIQTYYSLILKLLAAEVAARFHDSAASVYVKRLVGDKDRPELFYEKLRSLEAGSVYASYGIRNFLEGELFSWYLEEWDEEVFKVIHGIVEKLNDYDIEALMIDPSTARDIFKLLYEELVPRKEVRQKLGIYSTPDWLAELILDELGLSVGSLIEMRKKGADPLDLRILDPGAGTGTFLSLLVQRLGEYLKTYYGVMAPKVASEALRKITRNVVGFDIDALAVLTARVNYLIALAVTGLLEHKGGESIEIPVYMANSMITAEEFTIRESRTEDVELVEVPTTVGKFYIPVRFVREASILQLLAELRDPIRSGHSMGHKNVKEVLDKYTLSGAEKQVIKRLYYKLLDLKKKGVDDVWIPVIKSHIVSALYRNKFDYVIGNPPWIAYRYLVNPEYQAKIKTLVKDYYELVKDEHLMAHMEMATLFFARSVDLFLKNGGLIGFVMPRAVFSADQHDSFRRGRLLRTKYGFLKIIDCMSVEPLFYVPACAVIARKGASIKYPVKAIVVEGKLPEDRHKIIPLNEALARKYLEIIRGRKLYLNEVGARSYLDYEKIEFRGRRSYYYKDFYQGATIVPQPCWFVDILDASHPKLVIAQTARRARVRGKVRAEIGPLPVEREFIYGVLTSAEVLPFCHLPPNTAVLPITPAKNGYNIITKERAKLMGYQHLAKWLEEAEKIWKRVRGEKEVDLYEWLNYQHKLSRQNPNIKYKVVYLTSGTYITACLLIDREKRIKSFSLSRTIVGHTLYLYQTNDLNEAYYLTAILNSHVIDELVKPLQPKGQFGERHFTKKPLEFPIPRYDPSNQVHARLAELGKRASEEASKILPRLLSILGYDKKLGERGTLTPQEVARLRKAIRDSLSDILKEIDDLVVKLLAEGVKTLSRTLSQRGERGKPVLKASGKGVASLDKWLEAGSGQ